MSTQVQNEIIKTKESQARIEGKFDHPLRVSQSSWVS